MFSLKGNLIRRISAVLSYWIGCNLQGSNEPPSSYQCWWIHCHVYHWYVIQLTSWMCKLFSIGLLFFEWHVKCLSGNTSKRYISDLWGLWCRSDLLVKSLVSSANVVWYELFTFNLIFHSSCQLRKEVFLERFKSEKWYSFIICEQEKSLKLLIGVVIIHAIHFLQNHIFLLSNWA